MTDEAAPYKYEGKLNEGDACPKCVQDGKSGKEIGKMWNQNGPWDSVAKLRCSKTACSYTHRGYDNVGIAIGIL